MAGSGEDPVWQHCLDYGVAWEGGQQGSRYPTGMQFKTELCVLGHEGDCATKAPSPKPDAEGALWHAKMTVPRGLAEGKYNVRVSGVDASGAQCVAPAEAKLAVMSYYGSEAVSYVLLRLPASLPACLPACLLASLPAPLPASLPRHESASGAHARAGSFGPVPPRVRAGTTTSA